VTAMSQAARGQAGIDDRTKLALLTTILVLLFLFENPVFQFLVLALMVGLAFLLARAGHISFRAIITGIKVLASMLIVVVILQGFLQPGSHVLFSLPIFRWTIRFTLEGLLFGLVMASRFTSISIGFMMFFMTTSAYDLCRALFKMGVPYKYAYLVPMALDRFPRMVEVMGTIEMAQATRGFELETGSLWQKIKNIMPILIPLVITCLREAGNMSIALELKGFGRATKVTFLDDCTTNHFDRLLIWVSGLALLAGIVAKAALLLGWL